MKKLPLQGRTLALLAVIIPLLGKVRISHQTQKNAYVSD